ncbi:Peptidase family C78 [Aspergillus sp. HF37]|nr:Peptidase family C78 [Aspergillus sp. HF37]
MDHPGPDTPNCPFCPFADADIQFVAEHIDFCHPEGGGGIPPEDEHRGQVPDEPSRDDQTPPPGEDDDDTEKYVDCPHGCGEIVDTTDLSSHLDLHVAEEIALEDSGAVRTEPQSDFADGHNKFDEFLEDNYAPSQKGSGRKEISQRAAPQRKNRSHSPSAVYDSAPADGVRRLGRAELGPHAHEKKMPAWLRKMLEKGANSTPTNRIAADGSLVRHEEAENEAVGVVPALARLCDQDKSVKRAFLCSPKVCQIFKMPMEGGFCGYRNIQMLVNYIQQTQSPGHEHFPGSTPTILKLQDMIEQAWDMGFNSVGKIETGGIRGTRKYIGTPEAQALFSSLGIPCEANSIGQTGDLRAHDALCMNIAEYLRRGCSLEDDEKVLMTDLPPIYFQHQGHSMTIVGFEIQNDGRANLLIFDPVFKTSPAMKRFMRAPSRTPDPARLLKAYRRGQAYLQKYKLFEVLK